MTVFAKPSTDGVWIARHEDPGETEQQVEYLEKYISDFKERQKPEVAAKASTIDLNKELAVGKVDSDGATAAEEGSTKDN